MGKVFVYPDNQGGINVVHPVPGVPDEDVIASSIPVVATKKGTITDGVSQPVAVAAGGYIDRRLAELNGLAFKVLPHTEMDSDDLPTDRLFRSAWRQTEESAIVEDTEAAKLAAHEIRRALRAIEFEPLDKQANIALADQDKLNAVEAERQKVRDKYAVVQQDIDGCGCADDLREKLFQLAPALAQ